MSEPGEESSPSEILAARREAMNRRWNAELASFGRGPSAFPPWQELASWLVEQLPGSDPWSMGWGMINVTFMLYPSGYNPDISDNDGWLVARAVQRPQYRPGRGGAGRRGTNWLPTPVSSARFRRPGYIQ